MTKPNFSNLVKSVGHTLSKHSPGILTGLGIGGLITTTVLSVKATPKALDLIREEQETREEKLKPIEVVKVAWKPYIPAAITGATSIACLIFATSVSSRRNTALAAAYKLSETALVEYKDAVIETIGEKKEKVIREKISKKHIENNPISKSTVVVTGNGDTRFYDQLSGRYFISDIEQVKRSVNEANRRMLCDMYISLNELYDEFGIDHLKPLGDDLGWNIDHGMIEIDFFPCFGDDGKPCIGIDYNRPPTYGYSDFT